MEDKPIKILSGSESQLVEFAQMHEDKWEQVKGEIQILSDPEVQELAWKEHGFRTGLTGMENNPEDLEMEGLPKTIRSIIPMPTSEFMDKIVNALK